jgi:glycosyltransferase involved in cell wall biosynthesis
MARIGIDATTVTASGKGHSLTQRRSVEALARAGLPYELVALVRGAEAEELLAGTGVRCVRTEHRLMLAWEQVGLPRAVHRHGLDLVLTLTDRLPLWGRGRYVVWLFEIPVHRIEHARASGARLYWRASDLVTRMLWKGSLRRAARVVAGSEATAAEIQAAVPDAPRPIRVVYPGLDPRFRPGPGSEGQRYIFHLASADPRDNTEVALRAFAFALERLDEPVRLLVGGGLGERGVRRARRPDPG